MEWPRQVMPLNFTPGIRNSMSTPTTSACWKVSIVLVELICRTSAYSSRTTSGSPIEAWANSSAVASLQVSWIRSL